MRHNSLPSLVVLLAVFPVAGHQDQAGKSQAEAELLTRQVFNIGDALLSVNLAIQTAILKSGTAGGAAIMQGCEEPSNSSVRFHEGTLREFLQAIVRADPDYRWEVKDGVVDLLPAKGVPELLRVRVGAFDSGDATEATTAESFLVALPEVRQRAAELGFDGAISGSPLGGIAPGAPPPPPPKLGVQLHDVTLLEALNALVRANKHGLWIYREIHCDSTKHYDISFME